jgi:hypothetical protein
MQALVKNKILLGIVILFILTMFVYNYFIKSDAPVVSNQSALSAGSDLIKLSDELSHAQLSQDLFSKPAYLFLTDFSLPLPPQATGRVNPFEIIGRD